MQPDHDDARGAISRRLRVAIERWPEGGPGRQRRLAEMLGVSEAAVSSWLRTGKIRADLVPGVADALGVDAAWLLWGIQQQEVPLYQGLSEVRAVGRPDGVVRVPVPVADAQAYAVRLDTAAYDPRYRAGEYLLVAPSDTPEPGDDVLVRAVGAQAAELVQLLYARGSDVAVVPVTGDGPRVIYRRDELEVCVLVSGRFRPVAVA